ncbi:protein starmaker-like isoform X1 [Plodia interpunctella]|uniref:protein starmaker-like isoform X1 n=1 Tax=Plodia interpunctella TaxID=58824 RepID=UPI002368DF2B|nr:protein starmaker-like isoform X1 [Plodia interpunctella]
MCDVEEPPAKMPQIEMDPKNETNDDGQEEWLSEDMLTDDDNREVDQDKTDSNLETSQEEADETFLDEAMLSAEHSMDSQDTAQSSHADVTQEPETSQENTESKEPAESIEQTLNNLDNDSGDTAVKEQVEPGKSDGNDTDDLLRLLEDNEEKSKKKVLVKTKVKNDVNRGLKNSQSDDSGSSDDEFIFNGTAVQQLRMAKSALARKPATKAVPEEFDGEDNDTDCSTDDAAKTVHSMFAVKNTKSVVKKTTTSTHHAKRQPVTKVLKIGDTTIEPTTKKFTPKRLVKTSQPSKPIIKTIARVNHGPSIRSNGHFNKTPIKKTENKPPPAHDEIIKDEDFMEGDDFDLDDDFTNSDVDSDQQLRRPEQMDEDMPSDMDSQTDSDAMYDDVPSPECDDHSDWFSLDIRTERASDYLPLLGDKALTLLTAEKQQLSVRLSRLSAAAANAGRRARSQAQRLQRASAALADIDDMLNAT